MSAKRASRNGSRAAKTTSHPGATCGHSWRTTSRRRRRTRLRTTALPSRLPTEKPQRDPSWSLASTPMARRLCDHHRPWLRTAWKRAVWRKRAARTLGWRDWLCPTGCSSVVGSTGLSTPFCRRLARPEGSTWPEATEPSRTACHCGGTSSSDCARRQASADSVRAGGAP
jgi:hypothetical protein